MKPDPHPASERDVQRLWAAVRADRLFDTAEQFTAYCSDAPWRARVTGRGEASVLGVWRAHLDVLAMRGVWCSSRRVGEFVRDARMVARGLGLARVLSPLLPVEMLGPYRREGLEICQRITPIQGHPRGIPRADPPLGVEIRLGHAEDLSAIERLDAECFDEFWRYGAVELAELFAAERVTVAETSSGQLIGYTLATMSRGVATLGRLGVSGGARRHGLARALVAEVAEWADGAGAETISLCTQEENGPARQLYRSAGLAEVSDAYGFAIGSAL